MYFYLIVALQGFCIYHLYKNRNDYYWIFLIIFLPVLGCIIYIITQVYNKRDAEKITNEIATIINPSKKVNDLYKTLQFAETFQNRVNLADAYIEIGDYNNAIIHYEKALEDNSQSDEYVVKQLIECYFSINDFKRVVSYAKGISSKNYFQKSQAQFFYGLSLKEINKLKEAEIQLRNIDQRYSNYKERVVLAKFLLEIDKKEDASELLDELNAETQHMTNKNKKKYHATINEIVSLQKSL